MLIKKEIIWFLNALCYKRKNQFLHNLPVDFFLKLCIIEVGNNTGSLAEGIISADPGTPLFKK